ncbi:hypothetical protein HNQ71_005247 [Mesorhizobium sangaii]|uniref:Uncharacterized protein n=1 Tax=Mesorhizobium sangaii TaxID=505389 RepID=A0A841PVV1_9HYPH|nr:hypothetical protein [Mesorhizobium sangaii]
MAGSQDHAGDGQHDADNLRPVHAQAEEDEIGDDDQDRHRRLFDRDVDGRRVVERRVEDGVEQGEAAGAKGRQHEPVLAHRRPVLAYRLKADRQQDRHGQHPAQEDKRHRRDVIDRQLAGHRVAAPQQGGEQQEYVGASMHGGIPAARGELRCLPAYCPRLPK